MQKIVADSSVIVKWLNQTNEILLEHSDKILQDVLENKIILLTPELAKYEIGNALLLRKKITGDEAKRTFNKLIILPIQFVTQTEILSCLTYNIAQDANITYYDASFIAVAQDENAILVTDNIKHQGRYSGIKVKALKEY